MPKPEPRAGRPAVGPHINLRVTPELLQAVGKYAEDRSLTRSEAIRELLEAGLNPATDTAVDTLLDALAARVAARLAPIA